MHVSMCKAFVRRANAVQKVYLNLTLPHKVLNVSLVRGQDVTKRTWKVTLNENSMENVQSTPNQVFF